MTFEEQFKMTLSKIKKSLDLLRKLHPFDETHLDAEMKELGRNIQDNAHNTRSLIYTLTYVQDIIHTQVTKLQ